MQPVEKFRIYARIAQETPEERKDTVLIFSLHPAGCGEFLAGGRIVESQDSPAWGGKSGVRGEHGHDAPGRERGIEEGAP